MSKDLEKALLDLPNLDEYRIVSEEFREDLAKEQVMKALVAHRQGKRYYIDYRNIEDHEAIVAYMEKINDANKGTPLKLEWLTNEHEDEFGGHITFVICQREEEEPEEKEEQESPVERCFGCLICCFLVFLLMIVTNHLKNNLAQS